MALARKPFVVIDAEILSSSVWSEAAHVKLVWLTMLILCDTDGYVGAAIPGIARAAGVTVDQTRDALRLFMLPDPDSRTQANEGRRIEPAERGFRILNFREHLDRLSAERKKTRDRVRRFRAKKREMDDGNVTFPPGNRDQGVVSREKGSTEALSLHRSAVVEGGVGGTYKIERRRVLVNQYPRVPKESLEAYRARIDAMLTEPGQEG